MNNCVLVWVGDFERKVVGSFIFILYSPFKKRWALILGESSMINTATEVGHMKTDVIQRHGEVGQSNARQNRAMEANCRCVSHKNCKICLIWTIKWENMSEK